MALAEAGDVRLFFTDEGDADPPIVFIHGYSCDSHDWSWQLGHFAQRHRVIAVDLRGHGRSSAPPRGYDLPTLAGDVAELIRQLDCGPVVLIAHSMGAAVASVLAVEHPELVRAFVGIDPSYLVPDEIVTSFKPALEAMLSGDPSTVAADLLSGSYTPESPDWLRIWHRRRIAGTPAHVLRQALLDNFGHIDARRGDAAYLARRRCPVLVLWSHPEQAAIERTGLQHELSNVVVWPACGHWPHIERAAGVNALIDEWLGRTAVE